MKRIGLVVLLIVLLVVEVYLGSAFLPKEWQLAIQSVLPTSHDYTDTTHPALNEEVDQFLRRHLGVRLALRLFILLLLIANSWLLVKVWKSLRHPLVTQDDQPPGALKER